MAKINSSSSSSSLTGPLSSQETEGQEEGSDLVKKVPVTSKLQQPASEALSSWEVIDTPLHARHVTSATDGENSAKERSQPETPSGVDIQQTFLQAHSLNRALVEAIYEPPVSAKASLQYGLNILNNTQRLCDTLSHVHGHPDNLAVLNEANKHLELTLQELNKQSEGIKRFIAPKTLKQNKDSVQQAIALVQQHINNQPPAPEGHFSFAASPEARKEVMEYIKYNFNKEYSQTSKDLPKLFKIDATRQHFILSDATSTFDSSVIKQKLLDTPVDAENREEVVSQLTDTACDAMIAFTKDDSDESRFVTALLVTQTVPNAVASGLMLHDTSELMGYPTNISFASEGSKYCMHRQADGSLSFNFTMNARKLMLPPNGHNLHENVFYDKASSITLSGSLTLPKDGTLDKLTLGPVNYTFNLSGAHTD